MSITTTKIGNSINKHQLTEYLYFPCFLAKEILISIRQITVYLHKSMGRDLAQACRDHFIRRVKLGLWVLCEIAIAACDLKEALGRY
jgi:manganese transport protein